MKLLRAALLVLSVSSVVQAQVNVSVGDVGPGQSGRILRRVLAQPHRVVEPDSGWFILRRGQEVQRSLVVLGRTAAVAGAVDGDVVVVGGDLFVRPGARIRGRAIAIGGGVYPAYASMVAIIGGGRLSFRDNTFAITPIAGGFRLDYESLRVEPSPAVVLPGVFGLRFPTYDRVNGASIPYGPAFSLGAGRAEADLLGTFRSDIGQFDASIDGEIALTRASRIKLEAGRGTFTNDKWIWSDPVNSLSVFGTGTDARNYYRADRATLTLHRLWGEEGSDTKIEPFVGALTERAWSVGPSLGTSSGPWSLFGRTDSLKMRRPNPRISDGTVSSALVGSGLQWEPEGLALRVRTAGEIGLESPVAGNFVQFTTDLAVAFPTFGEQEYELEAHWVTTAGDSTPAQRFAYVGGPGTLQFIDLLSMGGDELLFIEQKYTYPLSRVRLGLLGSPSFQLRHRLGSAGLGRLPAFEQVLGFGIRLMFVKAELLLDPASGEVKGGAGLSVAR